MPTDLWKQMAEVAGRGGGRLELEVIVPELSNVRTSNPAATARRQLATTLNELPSIHHVTVQAARCTTMSAALATLGDALEFPRYYGQNLDAFSECLSDLLRLDEDGLLGGAFFDRVGRKADTVVISIAEAEHLLASEQYDELGALLHLMQFEPSAERADTRSIRSASLWIILWTDEVQQLRSRLV